MAEDIRERVLGELRKREQNIYQFCCQLGQKASTAEKWLYKVENNPTLATVLAVTEKLGIPLA
jgi:DNA-binding phage protein